jgi:biotin carboxyl carrier protein
MNQGRQGPARRYTLTQGDNTCEVEVWQEGCGFCVRIGAGVHRVSLAAVDNGHLFSLLVDDDSYELYARRDGAAYDLLVGVEFHRIEAERGHRRSVAKPKEQAGTLTVRSPMTGIVVEVTVAPGQAVERGEVLLVLESMKMNNELRAERAGAVESISVAAGQRVERGATLLQLRSQG